MKEDARIDRAEIGGRLEKLEKINSDMLCETRAVRVNQELLEATNKKLQSTIQELIQTGRNNMKMLESASECGKPE